MRSSSSAFLKTAKISAITSKVCDPEVLARGWMVAKLYLGVWANLWHFMARISEL